VQAELPPDEKERLEALHRYGILDTEPEPDFDDITHLATLICGTPTALMTLVDKDRQWFKSKIGTELTETSRDIAFCAHTILQRDVFEVKNAKTDERFASNPLVTGDTEIRFYAGAPLVTSEGLVLGTLCVIDRVPHELNAEQKSALQALSRQVVAQLELRRAVASLKQTLVDRDQAKESSRESEQRFHQLAENIADVFWITSPDLKTMYYISPGYKAIWGRSMESLYAHPHEWIDAIIPQDRERVFALFGTLMGDERAVSVEYRIARPDGTIRWIHDRGYQVRDTTGKVTRLAGIASDITARKHSDEKLELLNSAVMQATESILITDGNLDLPGPTILFVNPAFTRMTGYTEEEIIGKTPRIFQGPRTDKAVLRRVRTDLERGETFNGEAINYRKDGGEFLLEWQIAPVRDTNGRTTYYVAVERDITDRRRTEARFRRLFESNSQGVIFWTSKGAITGANDAFLRLVRYSREDLEAGRVNWMTLTPPEYASLDQRCLEEVAANGSAAPYEKEYVLKDGTRVPVLLGAAAFEDNPNEGVCFVLDLTERKKAEVAIRFNEQRYRSLVEATAAIVWDTPASGEFILEQPGWTAFTGQSFEELRGWGWLNAVHPDDQAESKRVWSDAVANRTIYQIEHRLLARDRTYHDMMVRAVPIQAENGTILQWIGVHSDITERKRLETQLVQSQKMETVGKLAGGIAHEFNSILTAIIGQSEFLLSDLPSGSPFAKNATEINKAAVRAASLTRQLLAYGRKQIFQPVLLDLNSLLTDMEDSLRHLMGQGVDVRFASGSDLKAVKADIGQIEQVIMNIALNARDAMPDGGKLTLETANVSFDLESVRRYPELRPGDYVMLAISDTGTGMTEEVRARVFDPFFSTKGVGQGIGLGLSTCYGIIKQSSGHISVYSELARGTTYKVYLPQVDHKAARPAAPLASNDLPRGTETILLVEDDIALREMAESLLKRLGYTVFSAANGIEALSLKQEPNIGHVDLLFTDVVMPHMSGEELSERVRSLFPLTKVLFTSAYTENAIVHQGVLSKGVTLLQKPFTPSALAHKLREVLDQKTPLL
jgi:PAS domain S-box-containing protein